MTSTKYIPWPEQTSQQASLKASEGSKASITFVLPKPIKKLNKYYGSTGFDTSFLIKRRLQFKGKCLIKLEVQKKIRLIPTFCHLGELLKASSSSIINAFFNDQTLDIFA